MYMPFSEKWGYSPDRYEIARERAFNDKCDSYQESVEGYNTLNYMLWNNPSRDLENILIKVLEKWSYEAAELDNYQRYM